MREYKVNATNAPRRFLLIAAESPLEAERLAVRDGYAVFGVTTLASETADGNEFEGLTPCEMRHLIRTLQEDLKRAVEDRSKLLVVVDAIHNAAREGVDRTHLRAFDGNTAPLPSYSLFARICDEAAKVKSQVEGHR